MDEWSNQLFIIWRTRQEANTVVKRRREERGGKGGMMMRMEDKRKDSEGEERWNGGGKRTGNRGKYGRAEREERREAGVYYKMKGREKGEKNGKE